MVSVDQPELLHALEAPPPAPAQDAHLPRILNRPHKTLQEVLFRESLVSLDLLGDKSKNDFGEIVAFRTVEHINDGEQTAPSKRIIRVLPAYEGRKTTAGPDIAEVIGLVKLREKCPHFDNWLKAIERL